MSGSWKFFVTCPYRDQGCGWRTKPVRLPFDRLPPYRAIIMHEQAIRHLRAEHLRKRKSDA